MSYASRTSHLKPEGAYEVLAGSDFGEYGEGYLRLTYSNSIENIHKAVRQIGEVVKGLH